MKLNTEVRVFRYIFRPWMSLSAVMGYYIKLAILVHLSTDKCTSQCLDEPR